jgi:NADPH:quinone reductase-like Zn-dependent oxidoreductase
MKAVLFDKKSSTERLTYCDVEQPIPAENEILVKIHAASVNAADYRMIQMGFPPRKKILGADVAGVVESAGKNVSKFKAGDLVIGELSGCGFGGFAEYVAAPESAFINKPKEISFEHAAAMPLAATTALQALRKNGQVKKGCQVLILGSSGGVGSYALQLARYYGATVTGVCSSKNEEQTRLLGADYVIDYNKENLSQSDRRYDLILGVNGNYSLSLCKKLLHPHGRYIMVGGTLGQIIKSILLGWLMSIGSKKMTFLSAKSSAEDMEIIMKLMKEGKIRPVIDRSFSLGETADAVRYMKEKHAKGKVIITVS